MTDVIRLTKKAFTWSVVLTTILWSMGVAALVPLVANAAECPALEAGDLFKVQGNTAVYLLNADMERMYFPHSSTYHTWYSDFSGVVEIAQTCVSAYPNAKNPSGVNFRPGSRLVKVVISPDVYAVGPDNMRHKIGSEAVAKELYGANWAKLVMDVHDFHWPNYDDGAALSEAKLHDGMLVKTAGSSDVWAVDGGMLKKVDGALASFVSGDVRTVAQSLVDAVEASSSTVTAASLVTDPSQQGTTPSAKEETKKDETTPATPATPAGDLTVSLAADTPAAATVVSDNAGTSNGAQANIPVLKLKFKASGGDTKVTTLKLTRSGISADTDINNMHLYADGVRLVSSPSISSAVVTFTKASGLFTVSGGATKDIWVKLDLSNGLGGGKTLAFSVEGAGHVAVEGTGTVGGSFPLKSNLFTTAAVTDLGKVDFSNSSPTAAGTVDPGVKDFEIWKLQAANTNQDTEIRKLTVTMIGSITATDISNLSLWEGGKQIGTTVAELSSDKSATFDLTKTPYLIKKGQTKLLGVHADIVAGSNRTLRATIQNSWDIVTYDTSYGVEVKSDGTDTFTVIEPNSSGTAVSFTINQGTLTQILAADSPSINVPDAGTSVTLGKYLWTANGEDLKITTLNVSTTVSDSAANLANTRLVVDGSQVGATDSSTTNAGAADTGWGNFGSNFIIKAGKTATVTIVADLTDTDFNAADTITVGFPAGSNNVQRMSSGSTFNSVSQNGNVVTVRAGTVNVTKNTSFGDKSSNNPTGTVNGTNVKVASMNITAGAGEDVEVTQIALNHDAASSCIGSFMKNLTIKDKDGKKLATTLASPASSSCTSSETFSVSPAVTILAGGQYVVDIFADLTAATTTAGSLFEVTSVTASGKATGTDASQTSANVSLQNVYIASAGALLIQIDPDTPIAVNHLMGGVDQVIAKYKVSASSTEAVNISQLVVSAKFSSGATGTVKNIRLYDEAGVQVGSAVSSFSDVVAGTSSPTTTYSHATFSNLSLNIPKGISKILTLKADFTTYEGTGLSTTGQTVVPAVLRTYTGTSGNNPITATGASSGTSLTATISTDGSTRPTGSLIGNETSNMWSSVAFGTTTTLYRAKLSTAWAGDAPSGSSSPSSAQTVGKFVITNLSNAGTYTATVMVVNFNFSTTISPNADQAISQALIVYKDSLSTTALATTYWTADSTSATLDPITPTGNTGFTEASFTNVEIASGAAKTFYVTMDTTAAASTENLSIRIPGNFVEWHDGISTSSTLMGQDLPLTYKTFTY